ncbi:MAG: VanW family protein [Clostridiales bacterium]|jgi:vancomycin resistance protein VanW|nr:VanW family protein [Clostridiales bacterium]
MEKKLFCELGPLAYAVSVSKERANRNIKNLLGKEIYSRQKASPLPIAICRHKSLIRRKLGNVDMSLQENKAVNLALTAPKIDGVLIKPAETFSFWKLAGRCTKSKGYLEGLAISNGRPSSAIGGGMCQFTNLIHWLVLHSPLEITEHHHHNNLDLFPDFGRQIPFGCGTSIFYNYLDYRFVNNTENTFQLSVGVDGQYLCGVLRAAFPIGHSYHIIERDKHFVLENGQYFRRNKVYRQIIDKRTGNAVSESLISEADAKVLYDPKLIGSDMPLKS